MKDEQREELWREAFCFADSKVGTDAACRFATHYCDLAKSYYNAPDMESEFRTWCFMPENRPGRNPNDNAEWHGTDMSD